MRRIAHYDYWSDKVRRSVLLDSKADLLLYGNAERAIVDITHRFARGETPKDMRDVRGIAFATNTILTVGQNSIFTISITTKFHWFPLKRQIAAQ